MDNNKVREIIARQNELSEEQAVRRAHEIVARIARLHTEKSEADAEIAELRKELQNLQAPKIEETSILGG